MLANTDQTVMQRNIPHGNEHPLEGLVLEAAELCIEHIHIVRIDEELIPKLVRHKAHNET